MLDIGVRTARFGRTSMQFRVGIWRGAEHITSGELVYVNVSIDPGERRGLPWPAALQRLVSTYERSAPETA